MGLSTHPREAGRGALLRPPRFRGGPQACVAGARNMATPPTSHSVHMLATHAPLEDILLFLIPEPPVLGASAPWVSCPRVSCVEGGGVYLGDAPRLPGAQRAWAVGDASLFCGLPQPLANAGLQQSSGRGLFLQALLSDYGSASGGFPCFCFRGRCKPH